MPFLVLLSVPLLCKCYSVKSEEQCINQITPNLYIKNVYPRLSTSMKRTLLLFHTK